MGSSVIDYVFNFKKRLGQMKTKILNVLPFNRKVEVKSFVDLTLNQKIFKNTSVKLQY